MAVVERTHESLASEQLWDMSLFKICDETAKRPDLAVFYINVKPHRRHSHHPGFALNKPRKYDINSKRPLVRPKIKLTLINKNQIIENQCSSKKHLCSCLGPGDRCQATPAARAPEQIQEMLLPCTSPMDCKS